MRDKKGRYIKFNLETYCKEHPSLLHLVIVKHNENKQEYEIEIPISFEDFVKMKSLGFV